jgi:hypothetical protein
MKTTLVAFPLVLGDTAMAGPNAGGVLVIHNTGAVLIGHVNCADFELPDAVWPNPDTSNSLT